MEELTVTVPGMWADHHVLAVRSLFADDEAVRIVAASALERAVTLEYDPARSDPQGIVARLQDAGYATGSVERPSASLSHKPSWATTRARVTATDATDLAMSGDHRKY